VRACVYMSECSYVYEYLWLYRVSKKNASAQWSSLDKKIFKNYTVRSIPAREL
jgi:hypothetical protein